MSAVYSFGEIVEEVLAEGRAAGDTGVTQTRVKQYVNQEYLDFCAEFDIPQLMQEVEVDLPATAQTDAKWPRLVTTAPMDVQKVTMAEVFNNDGNARSYTKLEVVDHLEFQRRTRGKDRSVATGRPSLMATRRVEGLRQDLQGSNVVSAVTSTSALDITQKVLLTGYLTATDRRNQRKQEGTLIGTSSVSFGVFNSVAYASKDSDTVGIVIISESGGSEFGRIMPWDRTTWYHVWEFSTFPDIAYAALVEYKRVPPLMTLDSDVPFFIPPWAYDELIAVGKARLLLFQEDADHLKHDARAREIRQSFIVKHMPELYERMRFKIR